MKKIVAKKEKNISHTLEKKMKKDQKKTTPYKPLIIGNWKLAITTQKEIKEFFKQIKNTEKKTTKKYRIALAPSSIHIPLLRDYCKPLAYSLCAQTVSGELYGAHTGSISPIQLKDFGVSYVLIGHSELRSQGVSLQTILKQIKLTIAQEMTPIVCIGESRRDANGEYLQVIESIVKEHIKLLSKEERPKILFAYEPIWAIGKGSIYTLSPHEIHQTTLYIKRILMNFMTKEQAFETKVLYGGSVDASNASTILKDGMVDGLLIGGASQSGNSWKDILNSL